MNGLAIEHRDGVAIALFSHDIDAANATQLRAQLAGSLGGETHALVVDLTETRYVDSAGIDMLLRLGELLRDRRTTLLLVIPGDSQLMRLVEIVGLADALPLHETLELAVASAKLAGPERAREDPAAELS